MVEKIEGATIVIGGDARPAMAAIDKIADGMKDLGGIAQSALAAFGAGFGVNELINLAKASAKLAGELSDLSNLTGASVTGLQSVRHAAEQAGVPIDGLSETVKTLAAALATVAKGEDEDISKAFERLGVAAADLQGLDIDQQFALIADAVSTTSLSSKDLNAALKTLGITQADLIALMREGGDAFEEARKQVIGLGLALSDVDAAAIKNASDEWDRFKASAAASMTAIGNQIVKDFSPLISGLLKELKGLGNIDFLAAPLGAAVFGLIGAFSILADGVHKVRQVMEATGRIGDGLFGNPPKPSELDALFPSERIKAWLKTVQESSTAAAEATVESSRVRREAETKTADIVVAQEDRKLIAQQAAAAAHLQALYKTLLTAEDFENQSYQRRLEQLIAFREQGLLTDAAYNQLVERNNQIHVDKINEATSKSFTDSHRLYMGYANQIGGLLGNITTALGSEGKKQFAITKALALASALVKGYEAIVSAYAAGSRIGGPPVGAAFAAIAAASTAAQIAGLRSTNENSSGGGGGAGGGGGDASASAQGASQTLTVQGIDPTSLISGDVVKAIATQLLKYQDDGGKVIIQ